MGIRAVLFDFGGVLTTSPFEAFARFEAQRSLPPGFLRRVNATNPDANAWARLERAEIGIDEFGTAFATESTALGHTVDGRDVLALLAGDLRPEMIAAVRSVREAGLLTAVLTNNVIVSDPGAPEGWAGGLDLDELFDVVVESSREGVRKPDRRAYELVLDRLGVAADEVVFLDDLGVNLKPARAMGMTTIKFEDPDAALDELESVLGIPLRPGGDAPVIALPGTASEPEPVDASVAELRSDVAELRRTVDAERDSLAAGREARRAERQRELRAGEAELGADDDERQRLLAARDQARAELAVSRLRRDDAAAELQAARASTTWRIGAAVVGAGRRVLRLPR